MPPTQPPSPQVDLPWVRTITRLLDDQFRIPGTSLRFGFDFLLGLVPGAGDLLSFTVSGVLVLTMVRYGASGMLVVKMIANLLVDALVGAIPLLGNIFDFGFKANRRNLRLLDQYYTAGKHQGSAWWVVVLVFAIFLGLIIALVYLFVIFFRWLMP